MKIENILSVQKGLYTVYGLWDRENQKWFVQLYCILVHFFFTFGFVFFMFLYGFHLKDLGDTIQFMYICLTEFSFMTKLTNLYVRSNRIQSILKDFNSELDYCRIDELDEIAIPQVRFVKTMNQVYFWTSIVALVSAYSAPILSEERIFPFLSYYPWVDWQNNNTIYGLLMAFQVIGMSSTCILNMMSDTFFSTQMSVVATLFDILGDKLSKLGSAPKNPDADLNDDEENLKLYMKFYLRILNITNLLEVNFSVVYFVQFSVSSIVICVTAFQISIMSPSENFVAFFFFILYVSTMVAQIFFPCYFGNEIILKSGELSGRLYSSNWINSSKQFRRMMVIFMERLKRPARVNSFGLFTLGLETFRSVRFLFRFYIFH